jgi:hypothetical protein
MFDLALYRAKDRDKTGYGVLDPTVNVRDRWRTETRQLSQKDKRLEPQEYFAGYSRSPGELEVARKSETREFARALAATFNACAATQLSLLKR